MSNNTSSTTNQTAETPEDKKPRIEEGGAAKESDVEGGAKKLSGVNVVLVSNDSTEFIVPIEHAQKSLVIGQFLSNTGDEDGNNSDEDGGMSEDESELSDNDGKKFPLAEVDAENLEKIVKFLKYEYDHPLEKISRPLISSDMNEIVKDKFYVEFVDYTDQNYLMNILKAANYMNIPSLLDLCCAKVASLLKDKSPEEVKKIFDIQGEFTEEEEAKITAENPWLEEL